MDIFVSVMEAGEFLSNPLTFDTLNAKNVIDRQQIGKSPFLLCQLN